MYSWRNTRRGSIARCRSTCVDGYNATLGSFVELDRRMVERCVVYAIASTRLQSLLNTLQASKRTKSLWVGRLPYLTRRECEFALLYLEFKLEVVAVRL
jgi:hypothetical protein